MSHGHAHAHDHGHSHGLIHHSIKRSRAGLRAVGLSLAILGLTALVQLAIFVATGSIALLADLIHNFGDAATAIPLCSSQARCSCQLPKPRYRRPVTEGAMSSLEVVALEPT